MQWVGKELNPKIKRLARPSIVLSQTTASLGSQPSSRPEPRSLSSRTPFRMDIVAIGVSTGGPNALVEVMPKI